MAGDTSPIPNGIGGIFTDYNLCYNMLMRMTYDPVAKQFMVAGVSLRDFYMEARREAGVSIGKLQDDSGLGHPLLWNVENGRSNSTNTILRALQTLGYNVTLVG